MLYRKYLNKFILAVFLLILMLPGRLFSETGQNAFKAVPAGLSRLVTAPLRWQGQQWLLAGMSVVGLNAIAGQDEVLQRRVQGRRCRRTDKFFSAMTYVGDGGYHALLAVGGMVLGRGEFAEVSAAALQSLAVSGLSVLILKPTIASIRPDADQRERRFFDYKTGGFSAKSFPSGHTASSFAIAEVYGAAYGRWWTYPLAMMVAYSRLHLNRHWTTDVLAGAALGIASGQVVLTEAKKKGPANRWWGLGSKNGAPVLQAGLRF